MSTIFEGIKTVHLFIKTDYNTVMLPVAILSYFATPHTSHLFYARCLFWTFTNLLYFCIANQVADPEEDKFNKPWRPIPSGRIPVRGANIFRALILPICLWSSWKWGVLPQCLILVGLGSAYNDLNIGAHWAPRHASVAAMYGALNYGAARAACDTCTDAFDVVYLFRHVFNSLVILTTIQAADFRDTDGDAARGRLTMPLVWPSFSRWSMPTLRFLWSLAICAVSTFGTQAIVRVAFSLAGLATGLRFQFLKSPKDDRLSYICYNLWLSTAQVLPFV